MPFTLLFMQFLVPLWKSTNLYSIIINDLTIWLLVLCEDIYTATDRFFRDVTVQTGEMDVRILIAEDEAIIALYIGMTLREAGHQVMGSVVRLDECLKLAEQKVPELALIDIDLGSGGSGIGVARVLLDRWGIMSIFVSAQQLEARKTMGAAIGCLHKPFPTRSLVESIEVAKLIQQGVMPLSIPQGLELFVKGAGRYLH